MAFKFESLKVREKAADLLAEISETVKKLPKDEWFVLTSQVKRVVDAVSSNIAEGSTGQMNSEYRKFLAYSLRSQSDVPSSKEAESGKRYRFDDYYLKLTLVKVFKH